jgi:hypothetical protein
MLKSSTRLQPEKRLAALENLEGSGDINRAWDNIGENIKISAQESLGYCESKHRKPWFDNECSKLVGRRKQAKLKWLQDQIEVNENNQRDVGREDNRLLGKRKGNM